MECVNAAMKMVETTNKTINMEIILSITPERVPYIIEELGEKHAQVMTAEAAGREADDRFTLVKLNIEDGLQVLGLLHAGWKGGMDFARSRFTL